MTEPPIFVVVGETGEGSSWISWLVGYSHSEVEAHALAKAAYAVVSIKYREWMGSDVDFNGNQLDEITNPFDPGMMVSPPGVKYTVHTTDHIGDLINVQAGEDDTETVKSCADRNEAVRDVQRVQRSSIGAIQRQDDVRPMCSGRGDGNAER